MLVEPVPTDGPWVCVFLPLRRVPPPASADRSRHREAPVGPSFARGGLQPESGTIGKGPSSAPLHKALLRPR